LSAPPLLSIGVPVYNGERYLVDALESALGQDYPNLEVLISDNASIDSTPDICRRFEPDPRVRYSRSSETTDPIANFGRVLGMAQGEYFTWLAHDDVLTSPLYAATLVETLEAYPDAVLCASALAVFRDDDPQARSVLTYGRFSTGEPWRRARRALFRWPPSEWETLVYGIFRRETLQRHFSANPSFRLPLQDLAFAGRFIIVPSDLRGYRLHHGSLARQRGAKSELDLLLRGVTYKWRLLVAAARSPAPLKERTSLAGVAARNFLGNHLAWAHSVPHQIRRLEAEMAMLAVTAEEREGLIRHDGGRLPQRSAIEPLPRRTRSSAHWFRSPDRADIEYLEALTARVADARRVCDELLAAIEAPAALDG
jgi:glycosyltransferase involved in cell wall biosynthesis